jgi:hypothetical protein
VSFHGIFSLSPRAHQVERRERHHLASSSWPEPYALQCGMTAMRTRRDARRGCGPPDRGDPHEIHRELHDLVRGAIDFRQNAVCVSDARAF